MHYIYYLIFYATVFFIGAYIVFDLVPKVDASLRFDSVLGQSTTPNEKRQNTLNPSDAIYNSNVSHLLSIKNLSSSPYRTTDVREFEHGILKSTGNITNNQTFFNTYLSDNFILGRGNGTFETPAGQSIAWTSSDLARRNGTQWVYYGIMLFNSTNSKSFSLLNNSIALSKSSYPLIEPEYIWLLK